MVGTDRIAELEAENKSFRKSYQDVWERAETAEARIAELEDENRRLKNRGTITSPMDGLFEENERLNKLMKAAIIPTPDEA